MKCKTRNFFATLYILVDILFAFMQPCIVAAKGSSDLDKLIPTQRRNALCCLVMGEPEPQFFEQAWVGQILLWESRGMLNCSSLFETIFFVVFQAFSGLR